MNRFRPPRIRYRGRSGLVAIVLLGIAWGLVMNNSGWAQSSHYAQLRALAQGEAEIDRWHWEGMDKAWIDGHFYSVKAPGLALASLPLFPIVDSGPARSLAAAAAENAAASPSPRWQRRISAPYRDYGYDRERARATVAAIESYTPQVWALSLFTSVLPAVALLLLVRWLADRLVPGYGTLAALTIGLGSVLMSFASIYASHVLAATLGFAAFAILFRERRRPGEGRIPWIALAGLLAGLAVTVEYTTGLVGAVLFFYAISAGGRLGRGAAYAAGAVAGALPALLYNQWALGSPLEFAYSNAVAVQGLSGHAELGLNSEGLFGITLPRLDSAVDLLFASKGWLVATPVIACAIAGLTRMRAAPDRAELRVIAAIAIAFFLVNSGYWLPFGGGTPGPRFLVPTLPFLALGLAYAYRAWPAITIGLAVPSAAIMLVAALTFPLIGENGTRMWVQMLWDGTLEHTVLTAFGVGNPHLAALPVLLCVAGAIAIAIRGAPRIRLGDVRPALAAIGGWMAVATFAPSIAGDRVTPLDEPAILFLVYGSGLLTGAMLVLLAGRESRLPRPEPAQGLVPAEVAGGA